ncbi:MAG: DUF2207 domain-containing protein, partial [Patescibacteria group bacterium]
MKSLRPFLFALIIFLLSPALVHAEYFDITDFKSDIVLNEDGTFDITENIDVTFTEQRHGIYRDIDTQGLSIDVKNVKDQNGHDW